MTTKTTKTTNATTIVKYGLRHTVTGALAAYSVEAVPQDSYACGPLVHKLELDGERDWLVNDAETARKARVTDKDWFNADYETPSHSYNWHAEMYEVVRVTMTTEIEAV